VRGKGQHAGGATEGPRSRLPGLKSRSLERWLPLLLVPAALLPDLAAALPLRTYFFRDFTATFLPLRLFAAREMREGRIALWNPLVFEGTFQLPALYPPDLLHALWPSPVFVSWLLTLHLPLAALAAYWLARELGASRPGAFLSGAVYSLGGFALSCLNLYVFLQALALAPLVAGFLRRAALRGGRQIPVAAVVVALALSTIAVEFVAQALLLGGALGLAVAPPGQALRRLAAASLLGVGIAGLPMAIMVGLLPETVRGAGLAPDVVLANAVHPAVLLQALLPNLFGSPQAPAEAWWGGRFFSKGLPYFLSLYVGPLALALAALGAFALPRRTRIAVLGLGALGLWYALGQRGGLAPLVARLPLASAFRFPAKALLLPHFAVALAAGFGVDRLRVTSRSWVPFAAWVGAAAAVALAVASALKAATGSLVAWTGVLEPFWPNLLDVARRDAALVAGLALVAAAVALAVRRGVLQPGPATALVVALAVADLARAGSGLNRQVHPSFFELLPETAALPLVDREGGRVFSYALEDSPAFLGFLARGGPELTLGGLYLHRQLLGPYTNMLDGVPAPEATDLTAFTPRPRELQAADYDPRAVDHLLPWLRNAAVTRVLALDPLAHPDLVPLGTVSPGPPGLLIHLYGLEPSSPRTYVACHVIAEPDVERATARPYSPGFDPRRDVAFEPGRGSVTDGPLAATCTKGRSWIRKQPADVVAVGVEADASGYLVVRDSYALGWRAWVDGVPAPVLRANGKHRAVPIPAGKHEVLMRYEAPGMRIGVGLSVFAALTAAAAWARAGPPRRGEG
jgi:hypothetical protein